MTKVAFWRGFQKCAEEDSRFGYPKTRTYDGREMGRILHDLVVRGLGKDVHGRGIAWGDEGEA